MNLNIILKELHKFSLSKLLVLGGFIVLLIGINDNVGYFMILLGLILYFRKF